MFNTLRTVALSALVGLGALAAVPAFAQADGVYLKVAQSDPRFGAHPGGQERNVRDWRRDEWRRDEWRDGRDWRRSCSPEQALNKAGRMGLHRARIVDASRHSISVAGRKYNDRVVVRFGRDRGCPLLYRYR